MTDIEKVDNSARLAGYADAMMDACAVLCGVGLESAKVVEILNKMLEKQAAYKVENPSASAIADVMAGYMQPRDFAAAIRSTTEPDARKAEAPKGEEHDA